MKHFILLLITLPLFGLGGCSKDEPAPTNPIDQLPPATQIGANKVGCLVNGEVFLPRGSNPFGPPLVTCFYQFVNNGWQFGLSFTNNSNGVRGVSILANKQELIQGQTYDIKSQQSQNSIFADYSVSAFQEGYITTNLAVGQIKITKLDQVNAIISGTFSFNAVKVSNGDIIKITEGRFDMKYSQ